MGRVPYTGGEKESLHASLNRRRDVMLWKLEGLDEDQLRRPLTPSGTNLLGLVKHLASVEYGWFCETFGRESDPIPFDENDPDADMRADLTRRPPGSSIITAGLGLRPTGQSMRSTPTTSALPGSATKSRCGGCSFTWSRRPLVTPGTWT